MAAQRRTPVRRKSPPRKGTPRKPVLKPPEFSHQTGHRRLHETAETVTRFLRRKKEKTAQGPPPKTIFPRRRTVNRELEIALRELELKAADRRKSKYWHFNENPELWDLRKELLELMKSGQIKTPEELNAALEQLIESKVEAGEIDQMRGMEILQKIRGNDEKFRLFTIEEKRKLKQFFGKYHREQNLSRVERPAA